VKFGLTIIFKSQKLLCDLALFSLKRVWSFRARLSQKAGENLAPQGYV